MILKSFMDECTGLSTLFKHLLLIIINILSNEHLLRDDIEDLLLKKGFWIKTLVNRHKCLKGTQDWNRSTILF